MITFSNYTLIDTVAQFGDNDDCSQLHMLLVPSNDK